MNYNLSIQNWNGRFGNNMLQISHGVYFARKTKSKFSFPRHSVIKQQVFDFSDPEISEPKLSINHDFFYNENFFRQFGDYSIQESENEMPEIMKTFILPLLPYKPFDLKYDLVMHFRGGDIFLRNPHGEYVQSSLSYFRKILWIEKPKSTLLVCEDKSNFLIDMLMQSEWNCTFQSSSQIQDINTILNARKLVCGGVSTFTKALALSSEKIEKVYYPWFEGNGNGHKINIPNAVQVFHRNYIKGSQWRNDENQKSLMVNHSENDIIFLP